MTIDICPYGWMEGLVMVGEIKGGGKEGGNWVNIKIDKWLMVDMYG